MGEGAHLDTRMLPDSVRNECGEAISGQDVEAVGEEQVVASFKRVDQQARTGNARVQYPRCKLPNTQTRPRPNCIKVD